jgi:precorrin-6B methylase 2
MSDNAYLILSIIFAGFVLLMLGTALANLFYRVPYVPSKMRVIKKVLSLAKLKKGQKVYDLGCGDGRFLIEAYKKAKVEATGFEMAPIPYLLAQLNKYIHKAKVSIQMKNFFKYNLHDADVIFCYLLPETLADLREKFQTECQKGTKIICHTFQIEGLTPSKIVVKNKKTGIPNIYMYQI